MPISRTRRLHADPRIQHALDVIYQTYGDRVSVDDKKKDLLKFGYKNATVSTSEETIGRFQSTSVLREVFASTNTVDSIVCDSTAYTGLVTVEGQYFTDTSMTFLSQTATMNSQTPVTLGTALGRATRMYTNTAFPTSTALVYVYDGTLATGVSTDGIPTAAAATKLMMDAIERQSGKSGTSISSVDYWIATEILAAAQQKAGGYGQVRMRTRQIGDEFRTSAPKFPLDATVGNVVAIPIEPFLIVPKNSDVEMTFESSSSGLSLMCAVSGYLAKIV